MSKCPKCNKQLYDDISKLVSCPFCGYSTPKLKVDGSELKSIKKFEAVRIGRYNPDKKEQKIIDQPVDQSYYSNEYMEKTIVSEPSKIFSNEIVEAKEETEVNEKIIELEQDDIENDYNYSQEDTNISNISETEDEENNISSGTPLAKRIFSNITKKVKKSEPEKIDNCERDDVIYEEEEVERYNSNEDGYYDSLIPELADQINRIPQENIIKIIFIIIAVVILLYLFLK